MANLPFWGPATEDEHAESLIALPGDWDTLIWGGGEAWPGLAQVKLSQAMKIDAKKAKGKNGGTPTFHGREPAKNIDIRVVVWTAKQFEKLQERLAFVWPKNPDKKAPAHHDITHPNCALLGVKSAFPTEVSGLEDGPVPFAKTISIKAQEFRLGDGKDHSKTVKGSTGPDNVLLPKRLRKPKPGPAGQTTSTPSTPANQNQSLPSQDASFTAPR